jgi:hypothetical protein
VLLIRPLQSSKGPPPVPEPPWFIFLSAALFALRACAKPAIMAHVPLSVAHAAPNAADKAPTPAEALEFSAFVVFAMSPDTSSGRTC